MRRYNQAFSYIRRFLDQSLLYRTGFHFSEHPYCKNKAKRSKHLSPKKGKMFVRRNFPKFKNCSKFIDCRDLKNFFITGRIVGDSDYLRFAAPIDWNGVPFFTTGNENTWVYQLRYPVKPI